MIHGYMINTRDRQEVAAHLKTAGCEKVHRDTSDLTGADRPRRDRVINQLASGDLLIVERINQLASSTLDLVRTLNAITARKANFRSLAEPWADTSLRGVDLLTALEGLVEFERDLRSARTEAGQARAVARGVKLGRRPKLTPKQEQEALRRRKRGETLATIAAAYNVSHSTISRLAA